MNTENPRFYYIDWLRVLAFGLLFVFHTIRLFDTYPWHLKSNETNTFFNYIVEFMHSWRMYIIFLVSGAGTYFAMKSKRRGFLKGRISRLIIPYIFGILIIIPPQKFFEAIQQIGYSESYFSFLAQIPQSIANESFGWNLIWTGYLGNHIWYLPYLFIQTMLFLPVFSIIHRKQDKVIRLTNKIFSSCFNLWLMLIPFIIFEFLLRPLFPEYLNWADFATFSLYFLLGYVLQSNPSIITFIEKRVYKFLLIGVSCWSLYLINKIALDRLSIPDFSGSFLFSIVLKNINSFSWVLVFLGLAKKFLDSNHRLLHDLNQGVLPFYILHQTLIIFCGYYIIQLNLSMMGKFLLVFATAFVASIGIYQVIKQFNLLRFLFGMKRK